jgi:hypothetical protein
MTYDDDSDKKSEREKRNDHVLAGPPLKKRGAPPFKVSSADPQTTFNGHVLNDRDRENSLP